jgi:signal peptidase II
MKAAYTKPFLLIAIIILVDQVIKTWVRTHIEFGYGHEIHILGDRGMLEYVENNGMAFGWELGGEGGKLVLTLFRILAVAGIGYGLVYLINNKYNRGLITCVALIFAGALGNIIDSTFYGLLYQHRKLFEGQVVDMFHFPLFRGTYPSWFPVWRGRPFEFFEPVFNLADASISVGVIAILLFQKRYFKHETPEVSAPNSEVVEE